MLPPIRYAITLRGDGGAFHETGRKAGEAHER